MIRRIRHRFVDDSRPEDVSRIIAWSKANGIDPAWVSVPVFVDFGRREIHFRQIITEFNKANIGNHPELVTIGAVLGELLKLRAMTARPAQRELAVLEETWWSPGVTGEEPFTVGRVLPLMVDPDADLLEPEDR